MRNAATVQVPGATLRPTSVGEQSSQPLTPAETAAEEEVEEEVVGGHAVAAAENAGGTRAFLRVFRNRAVLLSLACVAALLVGFGSVTAVLRMGDEPAQSDVKTPPTTAGGVPAPPSIGPPVDSAPRAPAPSAPAVESEPPAAEPPPLPQPAPAQPAPTPETPPTAPPSSAPPTTTPQTTTPSTTVPSQ
jgi:hypothetical protein